MAQIPLGGYNKNYNSRIARSEAINCYLEPNSDGDFYRVRRSPGLVLKYEIGDGPIRGMFEIQDELFVVSRNLLYKIDSEDEIEELGDVGGSTTRAYIDANGADDNQIIVVSDNRVFIYDSSATTEFQEVTDDLPYDTGNGVASLNQIFWVPQLDSNAMMGSDTADGFEWSALRRVSAEQNPDLLIRPVAISSALWLMGTGTCEYWQTDVTDTTNPIRSVAGATIQRGVGAKESIAKYQNSVFWLADDYTVWATDGSSYGKISDINIEYAIRGDGRAPGYSNPERAQGFFIDHPVHKMYVLTFPVDDVTWIYSVNTQLWHKRESSDIGRWRAMESELFNNEVLVGDYREGKIWLFSEDEYTEDGEILKLQIIPPAYRNVDTDIVVDSIELFMETGVGDISNINQLGTPKSAPITPKMIVEYSKDGGYSWIHKPDLSIGSVGDRDIRIKSRLFGRVRKNYSIMYRFTITDAVPVEMYELHIEVS